MAEQRLQERLQRQLLRHQPRNRDDRLPEAGVLLLLTEEDQPRIVLTRRAAHMRSHAGEVALPGGRREPRDTSILATALREAGEETGVNASRIHIAGTLSQIISRFGIKVTPVVSTVPADTQFDINQHEIDSLFLLPVSFLVSDRRAWSMHFERNGIDFYMPAWEWEDYTIWGLTASILVELVNVCFDANISLHKKPPGQIRTRP